MNQKSIKILKQRENETEGEGVTEKDWCRETWDVGSETRKDKKKKWHSNLQIGLIQNGVKFLETFNAASEKKQQQFCVIFKQQKNPKILIYFQKNLMCSLI